MRAILSLVAALLLGGSVSAQAERYELGQRLKAFEKQWDKTTDEKLKKKAAEGLPKLTGLFFTGQFGEAGRTLDEARWILEGKQPTDDEKWAESLYFVPETRLLTKTNDTADCTIKAFYPVKSSMPKSIVVRVHGAKHSIEELPLKMPNLIRKASADFAVFVSIELDEKTIARRTIWMSSEVQDYSDTKKIEQTPDSADSALSVEKTVKKGS